MGDNIIEKKIVTDGFSSFILGTGDILKQEMKKKVIIPVTDFFFWSAESACKYKRVKAYIDDEGCSVYFLELETPIILELSLFSLILQSR